MSAARPFRAVLTLTAAGTAWLLAPNALARAQSASSCTPDAERAVAAAAGRRITAIVVQTAAPERLLGGISVPLHVTTRDGTIRGHLLVAPGDALDTLRVAESLRQLRRLRFLAGAGITAACDSAGGVALTVVTRDAWSIRPRLSFRGVARATAGLEEMNLLGTGRAGRIYARSDAGQLGAGVAYADPTLFGGRAMGTVSRDVYAHGSLWGGLLRTQDAGVFGPWGLALALQQSARQSVARTALSAPGDTVRRATSSLLVSRRLTLSPSGATYLQVGAEAERTALVAGADLPLVGPAAVRRTFAGVDLGVARRSGRFVEVPWLLPEAPDAAWRGLTRAEVPLGLEGDGVVGLGRDLVAGRPAAHVDAWVGRVWPLGWRAAGASVGLVPAALLSADVWASGYRARGAGEWSGGALRASLGLVAPARRGLWSARVSAEQLADPDPDVRGLALTDPAFRAVPGPSRLAESAVTASVERAVHLRPVTPRYMLDAELFGAGSMRWDGARVPGNEGPTSGPPRVYVGSVGAGLRLTPTRFGPVGIRLDVGVPVVHSRGGLGRPYVGLSITPAFGVGRQRDGRAALGGS